jgi:hypothetical protein
MDEQRTLALLGWIVGGLVGLMFVLNAIALASLQSTPAGDGVRLASQARQPASHAPSFATGVKRKGNS